MERGDEVQVERHAGLEDLGRAAEEVELDAGVVDAGLRVADDYLVEEVLADGSRYHHLDAIVADRQLAHWVLESVGADRIFFFFVILGRGNFLYLFI